jgi:hypothetical protein
MEPMMAELTPAHRYVSWVWALMQATNRLQESILEGQLVDITSAKEVMDVMMKTIDNMNKDLAEKAKAVAEASGDDIAKKQAEYQAAQTKWQTAQGMQNTMVSAENSAVQTDAQTQSRIIEYAGSVINVMKVIGNLLASVY